MQSEKVQQNVREFLIDELGVEEDIAITDKLFSTGLIDSLDVVSLKSFIEKSYPLKFSALDITLDTIDSVESISAFIIRKTKSDNVQ